MLCNADTENDCPSLVEANPGPETIDVAGLVERCMGDRGLASQLLGMFQDRAPNSLRLIDLHLATGERSRAAAAAHALKGEAGNMGAGMVQRAAAELEQHLRSDTAADTSDLVVTLQAAMQRLLEALPGAVAGLIGEEQPV